MRKMTYKFRVATEEERKNSFGTSRICNIYDYVTYASQFEEKTALVFGQLKFLFGEPLYVSKDLEAQYGYYITAEDENGSEYLLTAYSGPSGPAIGGNAEDEKTCAAAEALAEYIGNAEASDYAYSGYYMDGPSLVKMGIKDGIPYYEEEELEPTEENFDKFYRMIQELDEE